MIWTASVARKQRIFAFFRLPLPGHFNISFGETRAARRRERDDGDRRAGKTAES